MKDHKQEWIEKIKKHLAGRTIVNVDYLSDSEIEAYGWDRGAVVLVLDNGDHLFASRDDEGNGPGALFTSMKTLPVIPTLGR